VPHSMRSSVVLPAPLGPMMARQSPAATERLTALTRRWPFAVALSSRASRRGWQASNLPSLSQWRRKEAGPADKTDVHVSSRHTPSGQLVRWQVSWLAGPCAILPSQPCRPVAFRILLAAYSCGGSHGLDPKISPCSLFTPRLSTRGPSVSHPSFPPTPAQLVSGI
jgi:hypothetical protein